MPENPIDDKSTLVAERYHSKPLPEPVLSTIHDAMWRH